MLSVEVRNVTLLVCFLESVDVTPPEERYMQKVAQPTKAKPTMTVGGKTIDPKQNTLKGKPIGHEEFKADMTDPLGDAFMDGDLIPLDTILNEPVNVVDFERREGLYGEYITIHLEDDRLFNIGSPAVIERMGKIYEQLPMVVVFVKKDLAGGKRMYSVVTKETFLRMEQAGEIQV